MLRNWLQTETMRADDAEELAATETIRADDAEGMLGDGQDAMGTACDAGGYERTGRRTSYDCDGGSIG